MHETRLYFNPPTTLTDVKALGRSLSIHRFVINIYVRIDLTDLNARWWSHTTHNIGTVDRQIIMMAFSKIQWSISRLLFEMYPLPLSFLLNDQPSAEKVRIGFGWPGRLFVYLYFAKINQAL